MEGGEGKRDVQIRSYWSQNSGEHVTVINGALGRDAKKIPKVTIYCFF